MGRNRSRGQARNPDRLVHPPSPMTRNSWDKVLMPRKVESKINNRNYNKRSLRQRLNQTLIESQMAHLNSFTPPAPPCVLANAALSLGLAALWCSRRQPTTRFFPRHRRGCDHASCQGGATNTNHKSDNTSLPPLTRRKFKIHQAPASPSPSRTRSSPLHASAATQPHARNQFQAEARIAEHAPGPPPPRARQTWAGDDGGEAQKPASHAQTRSPHGKRVGQQRKLGKADRARGNCRPQGSRCLCSFAVGRPWALFRRLQLSQQHHRATNDTNETRHPPSGAT